MNPNLFLVAAQSIVCERKKSLVMSHHPRRVLEYFLNIIPWNYMTVFSPADCRVDLLSGSVIISALPENAGKMKGKKFTVYAESSVKFEEFSKEFLHSGTSVTTLKDL